MRYVPSNFTTSANGPRSMIVVAILNYKASDLEFAAATQ